MNRLLGSRRRWISGIAILPCLCLAWSASAFAAGDVNTPLCSNETLVGFVGSLPDCRAYEMASPPFTDGQRISLLASTADGSRVLTETFGTFSGSESDSQTGAVYLLSRGSSGWATSPLSPSAATFSAERLLGASPDLGSTLWAARRPSQSIYAEDIYLREGESPPREVGSMVPPGAESGPVASGYDLFPEGYVYVGASDDLSHVLFTIRGLSALWPGDTTEHTTAPSLYQYVGTDNSAPQMVGVDSTGHLISDCGTNLGFEEVEAYNAISANGGTVFFTALGHDASGCEPSASAPQVSELYARISGIETIAVSEPSVTQCLECQTAVRAPAEFRGASEDGSKVFFTTAQELMAGAGTENLYEYDFDAANGHKIVRVSTGTANPEVLGVVRVSEDGSHVYFVARGVLTSEPDGSLAPGHQTAVAGEANLYVYERDTDHPGGHLSFVATLSEEDSELWGAVDVRPAQSTPDGRFIAFVTAADLTPGDTSAQKQVFLYDAAERKLARVSVGQQGYPAGNASADAHEARIPVQQYQISQGMVPATKLALSDNGEYVLFRDMAALTPEAVTAEEAGAQSVYLYHSTGGIDHGNVYLLSNGIQQLSDRAIGVDRTGTNAFLETAERLLPEDGDTQYGLYDARKEGGFARGAGSNCEAGGCHSYLGSSASRGTPLSASVPGEEGVSGAVVHRVAPRPTNGQQALRRALRQCRKQRPRRRQRRCEIAARRRYSRPLHAQRSQRRNTKVREK